MKMKKAMTLALVLPVMLSAAGCSGGGKDAEEAASYETLIFDTSRVHTIEITMSEEDRADQMANPLAKTKYRADAVIDGEQISDIAFHTKGNSSLFFTVQAGRDKFSYGLNFGKFTDGGTYHGLNKLNLQNLFTDASAMKEYMAFWLFARMGVDAPLASYVWLSVNGEVQGLYTAIEDVSESFLKRTADGKGTLYKPEDGDMALDQEEMDRLISGASAAHNSGGGADLVYRDDREESYPDIFENAETAEDEGTRERVIRALKVLSEGKDLDQYLDTEEIIRYFAVHNCLVNYDSYTGPMLHNYYLYENDGRLAMLPWDYDTCFGTFPKNAVMGTASDSRDIINTGIDSPLGIIADTDRPMWNWILKDEAYRNAYHDAVSQTADVIAAGEYRDEAGRVYDLIVPYLEKDPKAFFPPEKNRKAWQTVLAVAELRAESMLRQTDGRLAVRSEDQDEADKVDAAGTVIADMGSLDELLYGRD